MADIGQSKEELELKIAEEEYTIQQKETALGGILLNQKRMDLKARQYKESADSIKEQIVEHKKNIADLQAAIDKQ